MHLTPLTHEIPSTTSHRNRLHSRFCSSLSLFHQHIFKNLRHHIMCVASSLVLRSKPLRLACLHILMNLRHQFMCAAISLVLSSKPRLELSLSMESLTDSDIEYLPLRKNLLTPASVLHWFPCIAIRNPIKYQPAMLMVQTLV